MSPGFCCRDLVAVLIKYNEEGAERRSVVCSEYLPYDSEDPPPPKNLRILCDIAKMKTSISLWVATPVHIIVYGTALTATVEGSP